MITIFCDFRQCSTIFFGENAGFLKNQCFDQILNNLALFWVKNAIFFADFLRKCLKIITSVFEFRFWNFICSYIFLLCYSMHKHFTFTLRILQRSTYNCAFYILNKIFYHCLSLNPSRRVLTAEKQFQGPMLWFLKYFRRKFQRKNWRFWLKTKLNYAKFWS
jgi:hypothetical protein